MLTVLINGTLYHKIRRYCVLGKPYINCCIILTLLATKRKDEQL